MNGKHVHLHLVSDSTGETVSSVARAALAQFEHVDATEHLWTLIRSPHQMERVLGAIREHPGIVLYTVVDHSLCQQLESCCRDLQLPCIPVLYPVLSEMASYLGTKVTPQAGKQHVLNSDYFKRVDSINFSLTHDDGQMTRDLEDADIILVGVSRTSKSPTSMYLAFRGYKSANVPFVKGVPLPETLGNLKKPFVVGLVISVDRLLDIRKNRLISLHQEAEGDYVDYEYVKEEIAESRRIYSKYGWPVIDVTRKSVEETAATIINLYHDFLERRGTAA